MIKLSDNQTQVLRNIADAMTDEAEYGEVVSRTAARGDFDAKQISALLKALVKKGLVEMHGKDVALTMAGYHLAILGSGEEEDHVVDADDDLGLNDPEPEPAKPAKKRAKKPEALFPDLGGHAVRHYVRAIVANKGVSKVSWALPRQMVGSRAVWEKKLRELMDAYRVTLKQAAAWSEEFRAESPATQDKLLDPHRADLSTSVRLGRGRK